MQQQRHVTCRRDIFQTFENDWFPGNVEMNPIFYEHR